MREVSGAGAATYHYQDGPRYWYSTQPTVTKLAEDSAEQLKRYPDKVVHELNKCLRKDGSGGDFSRIHPMPRSGRMCPTISTRGWSCSEWITPTAGSRRARPGTAARAILEQRGNTPRLYRNTLVFLAADKTRLQDLDEAARRYLAWESILLEKETSNLDPQQVKQAETEKAAGRRRISGFSCRCSLRHRRGRVARFSAFGTGRAGIRASRKLRSDELLVTGFPATRLRMELDRVPLWRGDHVAIKQLIEISRVISICRDSRRHLFWSARSAMGSPRLRGSATPSPCR